VAEDLLVVERGSPEQLGLNGWDAIGGSGVGEVTKADQSNDALFEVLYKLRL
jgi:hypothetical protein